MRVGRWCLLIRKSSRLFMEMRSNRLSPSDRWSRIEIRRAWTKKRKSWKKAKFTFWVVLRMGLSSMLILALPHKSCRLWNYPQALPFRVIHDLEGQFDDNDLFCFVCVFLFPVPECHQSTRLLSSQLRTVKVGEWFCVVVVFVCLFVSLFAQNCILFH